MFSNIYNKWQQEILKTSNADSFPLFQRKDFILKMLSFLFSREKDIHYFIPEIIDIAERNNIDYKNFINSFFILRDIIVSQSEELSGKKVDVQYGLSTLQEMIIKIGSFFSYLKMDLNITRSKVQNIDSDRIEVNILQLDENFNIEKTNSILLSYFEYEKQEVLGKPIQLLFSASSQTIINNSLAQLKNNLRFKMDLEVEAQKKSGQRFQAVLKIARLNIRQIPAKYSVYIRDNTYIHETKSMLNLLSMALESAGEGIIILEPNIKGKLLFVNEAMEKMSGYSRHQLLGKPLVFLRNPQQLDELEQKIIQTSLVKGWNGEITNQHKKGHNYIIHLQTQPVKDEYGNTVAIVGIERDITQQKFHETQIINLKKFVEHIINHLPHFVFVTDSNLSIKFWNQSLENELKIEAEKVIGKNILEVLPELKRFNLEAAVSNVIKSREVLSKKFLIDFSNNGDRYYQLYITPISTEEGEQLLWTLLDITKEELLKIHITWQNARLKFLEKFSQLLNANLDIKSIFLKFNQEFKDVFPYKTLSFLLPYDLEKSQFSLFFHSNGENSNFPQNYILDLSSINSYKKLINSKKPQIENIDTVFKKNAQIIDELVFSDDINQIVIFPISFEKEILGILNIGYDEFDYYKQKDMDFLRQIASHLAIALKNSFYFNLIELQNKKLFIINSIFNIPQTTDNIPKIYKKAAEGIGNLLKNKICSFYKSIDGSNWEKISFERQKNLLPEKIKLPVDNGKTKTIFWDKFNPLIFDLNSSNTKQLTSSGIFSWEPSNALGYLGFLSVDNHILDQVKPDFVASITQDTIKQMTIALDQIDLFKKVTQAEKEWTITFDTVNIGLAVVDKNLKILRTNKALNKLFNIDNNNIIKKEWLDTPCCRSKEIDSKLFGADHVFKDAFSDEYFDRQINKTINRTFFPIFDQKNIFQGGVFSINDVSQQRLQESEIRFLSRFPETNPNIVISLNLDGKLKYMNPVAEKTLQELNLSKNKFNKIIPSDIKTIIQHFNEQKESYLELEHRFREHDFQYIIYRPLDDNCLYFYGTDITDKIALQRQLLQTEKISAVGEMAAGVAHDFNNLLATMLGRTQLMLLRIDNMQVKNELKIIENAAIDGGRIVRRLQEATRVQRDENFQPLDITEIIKESIIYSANKLKISTQLKGKQVQLHTDLKDPLIVKGNPVELKEVFTNLFLNAYDAMANGGDLYITSTKTDDNNVQIIIRDTGIGMSEEIQNKIFNPFYTTKGEKGTGLGLSIAYRAITTHGGHIKVDSEINKGSTFTITLPLTEEPLKTTTKKDVSIQEKDSEIRLLIVDDEPELLDTMAEILRLKFKTVEIAESGQTALEKISKQPFDVVLTDLGMPEMSGWELAQRVKESLPNSFIILVTGWGDQAREELKHHPYVDEILAKPYELRELIEKIGEF